MYNILRLSTFYTTYTLRIQKLIYLHLFKELFLMITFQSAEQIQMGCSTNRIYLDWEEKLRGWGRAGRGGDHPEAVCMQYIYWHIGF